MKKVVLTVVIILVCLGVALLVVLTKDNKEAKIVSQSELKITEFNIDNRAILKTEGAIYIGNNIKELENNFYDIKILNLQEGIAIYLNKLWYETYGEDYIQDEYLAKICRELSSRLNGKTDTKQFEYALYKYIKDNYVKVRQGEQVEKIMTDKLSLEFKLEDNVVKLIIKRGN